MVQGTGDKMTERTICDDKTCINHPNNSDVENETYDPDGPISLCDKCFAEEVSFMSVDDLMEVHILLTTYLTNAKTIEDILALPFSIDDIVDELMGYGTVEEVANAIKDKWTDRFNVMLQYKLRKDYG